MNQYSKIYDFIKRKMDVLGGGQIITHRLTNIYMKELLMSLKMITRDGILKIML